MTTNEYDNSLYPRIHRSQQELLQSLIAQAAEKCFAPYTFRFWGHESYKSDDYKALELQAFKELNRS